MGTAQQSNSFLMQTLIWLLLEPGEGNLQAVTILQQ